MRQISNLMLWVLLGVAVALVPIACGSSNSNDDGSNHDTAGNSDSMTKT